MRVPQPFPLPPAGDPSGGHPALDRDAAVRFLAAQCAWVRQGLAQACDPAAVSRVLSDHDTSHQAWLALIAGLHAAAGEEAARPALTLYAFLGRVAGCLERGPDPLLSAEVCADVRGLLEARLEHLTEAAITAVTTTAHAHPESRLV